MSATDTVRKDYGFSLPENSVVAKTGEDISNMSPQQALRVILDEDLRTLFEPALTKAKESKTPINVVSSLPRELPSQRAGNTPKTPALVMILSTRDATQPLRACGDLFEGEVPAGQTCTRNSNHRLLRLMVTDGVIELPAIELETLQMFNRRLPIPGEKLLLTNSQVRGGMIILEDSTAKLIGGNCTSLCQEYQMMTAALQKNSNVSSEAPKFASLFASVANTSSSGAASSGSNINNTSNSSRYGNQSNAGASASSGPSRQQKPQKQQKPQQQSQQQRSQYTDPSSMAMPAPKTGGRGGGNQQQQQQHHQNQARGGGSRGGAGGRGNQSHRGGGDHRGGRGGAGSRGGGRGGGGRGGGGSSYHQQQQQQSSFAQHQHQYQQDQQSAAAALAKCTVMLDDLG